MRNFLILNAQPFTAPNGKTKVKAKVREQIVDPLTGVLTEGEPRFIYFEPFLTGNATSEAIAKSKPELLIGSILNVTFLAKGAPFQDSTEEKPHLVPQGDIYIDYAKNASSFTPSASLNALVMKIAETKMMQALAGVGTPSPTPITVEA